MQQVDLVVGENDDRGLYRDLLQRLTDSENLVAMLGRERANDELLPRADLKEPLGSQQLERLPQRCLRDAEVCRNAGLRDDTADRHVASQDPVSHIVVCLLGERLAWRIRGRRHR